MRDGLGTSQHHAKSNAMIWARSRQREGGVDLHPHAADDPPGQIGVDGERVRQASHLALAVIEQRTPAQTAVIYIETGRRPVSIERIM